MVARFLPALLLAALFVSVSLLTRIALALRPDVALEGGLADAVRAFGYGLGFDALAALYVVAPMALWLALVPARVANTRVHRAVTLALFAAFAFGFLVLAVAEWLFWDEFGGRFNFIAVDYLLYTHEVLGNIWQSYPVGRILAGLGVAAVAITYALRGALWRARVPPLALRGAAASLLALAVAIGASLRWVDSDAHNFSPADAPNELAGNGLYEFFAANYRNELNYDRHYATMPLEEAMRLVRAELRAEGREGVERHVRDAGPEHRMNVVLVSVESLGAEYLGAYGDARGLTPNLDRLARESLWFTNVYATGNRTVRGLEALTLALPPTPGQSIVRRPRNDTLFSLGSIFEDKGYEVLFAYGGYGYFDNMNAFFDANDYRSVDRRTIPPERVKFENIWGVADESLFEHVLAELDRAHASSTKPVFTHVMTTSNHRPYTYPPGRIDIPSGQGREGGVKYSDYAIGRFLEEASARPWFRDTVFVITADHGANARGTTRIPVDKYRIPLFVYAPGLVKPQRVDRLMSQIDIAPTLLGLLHFDYYSKFFGRDVLHAPPSTDRAFVANYQTLGYLRGDRMAVLHPKRRIETFRVDAGMRIVAPVKDPLLVREAIAFYQSASHVFRNGLYLDEEQVPPEQRAGFVRSRHGG